VGQVEAESAASASRWAGRQPTDRFGVLLLLLIASFVITGVGDGRLVTSLAAAVNAAVLVVAFRSTGLAPTNRTVVGLVIAGVLGVIPVATFDADERSGGFGALIQVVILGAILVAVVRRVVAHRRVTAETLFGALCVYVLLGLLFGWLYLALYGIYDAPALEASNGTVDTIYYSFVTLTTVGFGDITSDITLVRRLSVMEAMVGQMFLATMVARLVALYGAEQRRSAEPPGPVNSR
jgi:hypothetical protein